jgi:AcrR family transcriptional regulator
MGRTRTVPDVEVYAVIRQLLLAGGDKAVAFSSVARATGLAAPTLVQRYGSRDGMVRAALAHAWDELDARTSEIAADCPMSAKGAAQLLKLLGGTDASPVDLGLLAADVRDPALRDRALSWRETVESSLAARLGGGAKGRTAAAILFAAWQGQSLWSPAGGRGFKLKDAVKRLA